MKYLNSYTVFSGAFYLTVKMTKDTSEIDGGMCQIQAFWSFKFKTFELWKE